MIAFIEGQVLMIEPSAAIIKTQGLGYKVYMCASSLEKLTLGQEVRLFVHTHIKEDAFDLFGFEIVSQRAMFTLLISVSHIGPKLGLAILSALPLARIARAISERDLSLLSSIPGIGKKTAERIALELKDKVNKIDLGQDHFVADDVQDHLTLAIRGLGYSRDQAERVMAKLDSTELKTLPLEALIKKSLNLLTNSKAS